MNTCGGRLPPTGGSLLEVPTRFSGYDSISYATRSTLQSELLLYLQCPQNSPTGLSNRRSDRASASQRDIGASRNEPAAVLSPRQPVAQSASLALGRAHPAVSGSHRVRGNSTSDTAPACPVARSTPHRRPCYFVSTFIPAKTTEIVGYNRGVSMHVDSHATCQRAERAEPARRGAIRLRLLLSPVAIKGRQPIMNSASALVRVGGAEGTRTPDPLTASQMRYQLRHSPLRRRRYTTRPGPLAPGRVVSPLRGPSAASRSPRRRSSGHRRRSSGSRTGRPSAAPDPPTRRPSLR